MYMHTYVCLYVCMGRWMDTWMEYLRMHVYNMYIGTHVCIHVFLADPLSLSISVFAHTHTSV